jgi:hypothetical protein
MPQRLMSDETRETMTFLQAEGLAPLPQQLELGQISKELRALLWAALHGCLSVGAKMDEDLNYDVSLARPWRVILYRWHVFHEHRPSDEYDRRFDTQKNLLKNIVWNRQYADVFELITFILRDADCPELFAEAVADALKRSRAAYRVVGKTIFPIGSTEEATTLLRAYSSLSAGEFGGARSHLEAAGGLLTGGDFAGSVRESIHAVESVAKLIEPKGSTLADALQRLDKAGRINPNLKRGLNALYDYSSDERGIRHAKVFGPSAAVDETDALLMLGSCAAFVSYLIQRSRMP